MKKIVCKTNWINTLTKGKVYDIISGGWEVCRFYIKDDFENEQWYYSEHFYTLEEMREEKLEWLLRDSRLKDLGI
jgi:hypothetical protein